MKISKINVVPVHSTTLCDKCEHYRVCSIPKDELFLNKAIKRKYKCVEFIRKRPSFVIGDFEFKQNPNGTLSFAMIRRGCTNEH